MRGVKVSIPAALSTLGFLLITFSPAGAATLQASPSTFSSIWNNAVGGDTILLAPGNYSFAGGSKSSMVTIKPDSAAGGTQSNVVFGTLNLASSQNIRFQGLTIGGTTVGGYSTTALHIHFIGNRFTGPLCINTPSDVNQDTLVDGNTFINIPQGCTEGRIGVTGTNRSHSVINGVVISNNLIQGSGPSDGVQIIGGAYGTIIGPGNEFVGIKQSGCGAVHCDPIQFYGARKTTVTGNYFHGNSTGIMSPDCNGTQLTLTNNVFVTDGEYADQVVQGGSSGDVFSHNTFAGGARIWLGNPNSCSGGLNSSGTITDNIVTGGIRLTNGQTLSGFNVGYNLIPGGGTGTGTISGSPTYVGGSSPATFAGYALASNSLGRGAASDGKDIGIMATTTTAPTAPTSLTATVH